MEAQRALEGACTASYSQLLFLVGQRQGSLAEAWTEARTHACMVGEGQRREGRECVCVREGGEERGREGEG